MPVLIHPFEPVYDARSRVLILGTFPSPRSRETGFYYGNPQNAFWRTLARALDVPEPGADKDSRRAFLLENRVAVWDVLYSCEIEGAKDGSIASPVANKLLPVIQNSDIKAVFTTGRKATELYAAHGAAETGIPAVYLPSTSPANRSRWNTDAYIDAWAAVKRAVEIFS
ncbi:MAG: DNA-deoxyinosine glycosylase [Oscillospiraceae bacterium]|jgi:hypoxanthine-DNA glycosylase|nr:DNA-deoxyinosine glycosylase [Oscillospiraceae bacterium]